MDLQGWGRMGVWWKEESKKRQQKNWWCLRELYPTTTPQKALSLPSAHALEPKCVQGWGSQQLWSQTERFGGTLKRRKGQHRLRLKLRLRANGSP